MAFVCDDHAFSCRINDEASICTAELLDIEAAIEYIWESSDEEFMVITDSLSSLQALKRQKLKNPMFSAWYPAILGYRAKNGLMCWPRLPWIRQNSFIIYHVLISSTASLVYLDDILQGEWNINVTSKMFKVQPIIIFYTNHKAVPSNAPQYIQTLFTDIKDHSKYSLRSSTNNKLFVPGTHHKSFSYTGVIFWNALPENIKKSETFAKFKQLYIKKTLEENK